MKRPIKIIISTIVLLLIFYIFLTFPYSFRNYSHFMLPRYNKVITEPLAKMGFAEQQYKMGLYYYNDFIYSFTEGCEKKGQVGLEKAIYWWEKAATKGHQKAVEELKVAKNPEDNPQRFL